jgi:predicted nucleic acid-binding protein
VKVLDATYLIDYLAGDPRAADFYEDNGGADEYWIMPAPAHAEALVGVSNHPGGDIDQAVESLSWGEVYPVDAALSIRAARIADAVGSEGPYLDGVDAIVGAIGRDLEAPVVSRDGDLSHPETKRIIDIEEY